MLVDPKKQDLVVQEDLSYPLNITRLQAVDSSNIFVEFENEIAGFFRKLHVIRYTNHHHFTLRSINLPTGSSTKELKE